MVQVAVGAGGQTTVSKALREGFLMECPVEVGVLNGHLFVPRDTMTIPNRDYIPMTTTCPMRNDGFERTIGC